MVKISNLVDQSDSCGNVLMEDKRRSRDIRHQAMAIFQVTDYMGLN